MLFIFVVLEDLPFVTYRCCWKVVVIPSVYHGTQSWKISPLLLIYLLLLFFRLLQPTLHKPGIMAHEVRVLHNPTQKTIRMHYASKFLILSFFGHYWDELSTA